MLIEIHEHAREDLIFGFQFYEQQALGLGRYFLECLFADVDSLNKYAGVHEMVDGFQRLLSKRFPFAIYYTVVGDEVKVAAILDCRRDPQWIQRRLRRSGDR